MHTLISSNIAAGLLAAVFWGGGDFAGGMGAKRAGGSVGAALRVVLVSHVASLCVLLLIAAARGDIFPHGLPLLSGVVAGVAGGLSLVAFYIALARGAMGVAAAVSGLVAAAIPAAVSMAGEGSPGSLRIGGFLVAGVAIWLVAAAPTGVLEESARSTIPTIALAGLAGAGFGVYFVALKMAGAAGVVWPMATARMGSICTCSLLLVILPKQTNCESRTGKFPIAALLWALSATVLDTSGNLLFITATRLGRLDIAAVLASLYPVTTILLAGFVLKERFSRRQGMGLVIAAIAVAMVTF